MSQENVELVRSGYSAPEPLTMFAERSAPDVEFDFTAVYPDRPVFRGPDAVRRFIETGGLWGGAIHFEPERFFDVDNERVLVFVRATAVGQVSGAATEARAAHEFTIRNGLLVRFKAYRDRSEALETVRLRE
jgi:ketosteroid isomerase-like protein